MRKRADTEVAVESNKPDWVVVAVAVPTAALVGVVLAKQGFLQAVPWQVLGMAVLAVVAWVAC